MSISTLVAAHPVPRTVATRASKSFSFLLQTEVERVCAAKFLRPTHSNSDADCIGVYFVGCGMYLIFTLLMVPLNLNGAFLW